MWLSWRSGRVDGRPVQQQRSGTHARFGCSGVSIQIHNTLRCLMVADVVFTAESPWYTNSHTWKRITEYAASRPGDPLQEDYHSHLDALGVDFTFLPDSTAAEVAGWLSVVIEGILRPKGPSRLMRLPPEDGLSPAHREARAPGRCRQATRQCLPLDQP